MERGDRTRICWLDSDKREEIEERKRREDKVRMSIYVPESIRAAVAHEARRLSHGKEKRVPMNEVIKRAIVLYFEMQFKKEMEEKER